MFWINVVPIVFIKFSSLCFAFVQNSTDFWYIFSDNFFQPKDTNVLLTLTLYNQFVLDFVKVLHATTEYGQHLSEQTFITFNFGWPLNLYLFIG